MTRQTDAAAPRRPTPDPIVVMGVSGCGKSTVARLLADHLQVDFVEGDDFHSTASRAKMAHGTALDDRDRDAWLHKLVHEIRTRPHGVVLTCSALKKRYRDTLRAGHPRLRFVFLALDEATAMQRVSARADHFFDPGLVRNQFVTLEAPDREAGVLALDAMTPAEALAAQAADWILQSDVGRP